MPLQSDLFFVCAALRSVYEADTVACVLVDEAEDQLVAVAVDGVGAVPLTGAGLPRDEGVSGWVVSTGLPVCIRDLDHDDRYRRDLLVRAGYLPTVFLGAPMLTDNGRCLGLIAVMDPAPDATQAGLEMELLIIAAAQVASLVQLDAPREAPTPHAIDDLTRVPRGARVGNPPEQPGLRDTVLSSTA